LITLALLLPCRTPFAASATIAPVESIVVLDTAGASLLQGAFQVVNGENGNQTSPRVDCDIASYTYDDLGISDIHYQNLSTGVDNVVPGNHVDLLADVSGPRIAFVEVTNSGDTIRVFDTIKQNTTVVPGYGYSTPSIGGDLVAFEDRSSNSGAVEIATYDLNTGIVTRLTNDSLLNSAPNVSPNGDAVVWEQCQHNGLNCQIRSAIQTAPGVFTTTAIASVGATGFHSPSTNGTLAVYLSDQTGERDVYYQPVTGGTAVRLNIPGLQRSPTISGNFISFESFEQNQWDIFAYDIPSAKLFRVTNTLPVDERLNEISVCGNLARIVYVKAGNGSFDTFAFTFQVPSVAEDQIDDLIALIGSFNLLPGTANSLVTKLQTALDAIDASDTATACSSLTAFINECQAQSGKKLTPDQSTQLINSANHTKTSLGCP